MFISMVRLALVTSVMCRPPAGPPVRFQISQLSIVPNSTSPSSARCRSPSTWSNSQRMRGAEKYVEGGRQQRRRKNSSPGRFLRSSTSGAVRVSCQTIALPSGVPVRRSHSTVVSRWLAIPMAATSSGLTSACESACGTTRCKVCQISTASCSTHPGRGKCCSCSCWATDTSRPPWSKRMHRVEVVPWSMDITYRSTMISLPLR